MRCNTYLGAEAVGSVIVSQTGPDIFSHGAGVNVYVGFRLHKRLAVEVAWSPIFHQRSTDVVSFTDQHLAMQSATLDFKFFPLVGRVQPFVTFGPGAYFLAQWTMQYYGGGVGFQAGGGRDILARPAQRAQHQGAVSRRRHLRLRPHRHHQLFQHDRLLGRPHGALLSRSRD
jgi:hypothetical protein